MTANSSSLSLGLQLGCLLPLLAWILSLMIDTPEKIDVNLVTSESDSHPTPSSSSSSSSASTTSTTTVALNILFRLGAVPLYRAAVALLALGWMWVGCLFVFHRQHIQLALTLRLRAPLRLGYTRAARSMTVASLLCLCNLLVYLLLIDRVSTTELVSTATYRLIATFLPLSLLISLIVHLVFLFRKYKHEVGNGDLVAHADDRQTGDDDGNARTLVFLLESIGHSMIAPFGRLTFRDGLVADVLTSMVRVLADLERVRFMLHFRKLLAFATNDDFSAPE
jgi:hypothetical protein